MRLLVSVTPGARLNEVVGRHGDGWKVRVIAAAERGRANDAVTAVLAETLGIKRDAIRILSGRSARQKVIEIEGLGEDEAGRRLEAAARTKH